MKEVKKAFHERVAENLIQKRNCTLAKTLGTRRFATHESNNR